MSWNWNTCPDCGETHKVQGSRLHILKVENGEVIGRDWRKVKVWMECKACGSNWIADVLKNTSTGVYK